MKTAISLPDDLFEQADRLAQRLGKSRSELFREAITDYLARRSPDAVTEALDRVVRDVGGGPDPFLRAAGAHRLADVEW